MKAPSIVPCPTCREPASLARDNPNRPFCSERCRLLDLDHWLSEDYVVSRPAYEMPLQPERRE